MNIDLSLLHSNSVEEIDISNDYSIPKEYINDDSIIDMNNIEVQGKIYKKNDEVDEFEENDYIECTIKGKITIKDSISLEPIEYEINTSYDDYIEENCKKNENTLDIYSFLWENILLEVPLQYTKVEDLSKFHGDGWKLISEEERINTNNPFSELLKDYDKE